MSMIERGFVALALAGFVHRLTALASMEAG